MQGNHSDQNKKLETMQRDINKANENFEKRIEALKQSFKQEMRETQNKVDDITKKSEQLTNLVI